MVTHICIPSPMSKQAKAYRNLSPHFNQETHHAHKNKIILSAHPVRINSITEQDEFQKLLPQLEKQESKSILSSSKWP